MAVPWDSRCLVRITWEQRVILTRIEWLCAAKNDGSSGLNEQLANLETKGITRLVAHLSSIAKGYAARERRVSARTC